MSEPVSALPNARFEGAVTVRELGLRGMITLRGDLASEKLASAVSAVTGLGVPGPREVLTGNKGTVAWMSPDELLVMLDYSKADAAVADITETLQGEHHLAVNISDARAIFSITGKGAREVLAKGAPVDLSPQNFRQGEFRRTRLGQLGVAFWMTGDDAFTLVCFRSVAEFMFDWLKSAARPGSLPEFF